MPIDGMFFDRKRCLPDFELAINEYKINRFFYEFIDVMMGILGIRKNAGSFFGSKPNFEYFLATIQFCYKMTK